MATKRARRIDPSEAFASIVGGGEDTLMQAVPAPEPAPPPTAPVQTAPSPAPAPVQAIPPEPAPFPPPSSASPKLVQKGYYLREDQAKQLGIYAAITGADKSSVIRAALDEYFQTHPAGV